MAGLARGNCRARWDGVGPQQYLREHAAREAVALQERLASRTWAQAGGIVVGTVAGGEESGFEDGPVAQARFECPCALALLPDERVLVADGDKIRVISADLQHVSTVAGTVEGGYQDGPSAQARFEGPSGLAVLPDGRVLVADYNNERVRVLSADLREVSTVAGGGPGHTDGAAAVARFSSPVGFALLPDGRVLVVDQDNESIRALSADLAEVTTIAGRSCDHSRDGPAAEALFAGPGGASVLPGGRVLVASRGIDRGNARDRTSCIRVLSADLGHVGTVLPKDAPHAGAAQPPRDGAAAQAECCFPRAVATLPDGRVLIAEEACVRMISADLQQVSTVAGHHFGEIEGEEGSADGPAAEARFEDPRGLLVLPDGRVLVAGGADHRIRVIEGIVPMLGTKPARKPSKRLLAATAAAAAAAAAAGGGACCPLSKRARGDGGRAGRGEGGR